MNGNGFTFDEAPASGGILSDFLGAAQTKLGQLQDRYLSRPSDTQSSVGGSIFEALYQFGAGKVDAARAKAASALLQSGTGQRFVAEVEQQRIQQMMPLIIGSVIVLLILGFFFGRR